MSKISYLNNEIGKFVSLLNKITNNKRNKYVFIITISITIVFMFSSFFILTNRNYDNKVIAKIVKITEENLQTDNMNENVEHIKNQQIKAVILNGSHKGQEIELHNIMYSSLAFSVNYKVNDSIIVAVQEDSNKKIVSSNIVDFKRDKYIGYTAILFTLLIVLIGGFKGFKSLISVMINIIIFSATVELLLHGYNTVLIASIASILFIIISISIVSGKNKKTISAIIGTMVGTLFSILIAVIVIHLTKTNGIGYQEADFISHLPPETNFTFEQIFLVEILIGTLGAIMDIAISISSSIKEIYDKNPHIQRKMIINSGFEIGKDIMGTMANTLVFAYISGSIPMMLILIKNGIPFFSIININISLEIIRALSGSIGIVLSIPITIYISVLFLNNHQIGEC